MDVEEQNIEDLFEGNIWLGFITELESFMKCYHFVIKGLHSMTDAVYFYRWGSFR